MENSIDLTFILVQVFAALGLISLIIPGVPGLVIIWLSILVYGLVNSFASPGLVIFIVITILMLVGNLSDNFLIGAGAKKSGASWKTILLALLAGIVGTLVFPPFGGILAAGLAVFLLEYQKVKNMDQAWLTLRGMAAGWGLAYIVRFVIGIVMIVLWWFWVAKI